ncbi:MULTISPECIES: helix-turn-helix domain-containing protein [Providencia]|uniref:helix-turn-helix domain-containing protein n=1 Tax=Providencia TaxID=586 RepID=UPI00044E42DF|nr:MULTISPECIES: XRE family transcriptional regulator [Providencia]ETT03765.1 DNA-binding helix-turn-helix protein [Providencia alcalifaciens F90-2004]EUC97272.1 DNA-binding helix-turn-helix protein [Providencia alcalifaciens PAL-2]EUD08785.1 DNA-binding helix-turn-helix protein [Providencia alcalifaciens R90-1475]MTB33890.1 helix-turn-helix domain-containing protein [Providencia alcalifaciens]MTC32467.1 helix-turn-helix domain-containing protein [Providencia alcalifaciens]
MFTLTLFTPPIELISKSLACERQKSGMSLSELARKAGIAKSTLSQLEAGSGNPSIETLWALCVALDIPFSRLIEEKRAAVTVIRHGEGTPVSAEHANYLAYLLSSAPVNSQRDIYTVVAQPGRDRISSPHMQGVTEHIILMSGRALVGPLENPVELNVGDYIHYRGDEPHIMRALEPNTMAVMVIDKQN